MTLADKLNIEFTNARARGVRAVEAGAFALREGYDTTEVCAEVDGRLLSVWKKVEASKNGRPIQFSGDGFCIDRNGVFHPVNGRRIFH